jgi:hypothetical protein
MDRSRLGKPVDDGVVSGCEDAGSGDMDGCGSPARARAISCWTIADAPPAPVDTGGLAEGSFGAEARGR